MSDPDDDTPRRIMSAAFWAMILFGCVCIAAGAVVGRYGPQLFPKNPPPSAAARPLGKSPAPR